MALIFTISIILLNIIFNSIKFVQCDNFKRLEQCQHDNYHRAQRELTVSRCDKPTKGIFIEKKLFHDHSKFWCIIIDNRNDKFHDQTLKIEYSSGFKILWTTAVADDDIQEGLKSKLRLKKGIIRIVVYAYSSTEFPEILSFKVNNKEMCSNSESPSNTNLVQLSKKLEDYRFLNDCRRKQVSDAASWCDDIRYEGILIERRNLEGKEKYWCILIDNSKQRFTQNDIVRITFSDANKFLAWTPTESYHETNSDIESAFNLGISKLVVAVSSNGDMPVPDIESITINHQDFCKFLKMNILQLEEITTNHKINENIFKTIERPRSTSTTRSPLKSVVVNHNTNENKDDCGRRKIVHQTFITHGNESKPGSWPWHAAIYLHETKRDRKYICGGSLINRKTVLTAAHCIIDQSGVVIPERLRVELGRHDLTNPSINTQAFKVYDVIPHDNFNPDTIENDIGLLILSTYAILTNYVQLLCLPSKNKSFLNQIGAAVGWGRDEQNLLQNTLRETTMPVIDNIVCLRSNRAFFGQYLTETNFCAGFRNSSNVCQGDSGGALSFNNSNQWTIGGITSVGAASYGSDQCDITQYAIFTDVSKFIDWINLTLSI